MAWQLDISRKSLLATVASIAVVYPNTWAMAQEAQSGETELPPVSVEQQPQAAQPTPKPKPATPSAKPASAAAKSKPKPKPQAAPSPPPEDYIPAESAGGATAGGPVARAPGANPYANPDAPYKVETSGSSKFTQPLVNTPKTITALSKELIKDKGATDLRELARQTPGVTIHSGEGGASFGSNFEIRGFNARNDIFVDGIRDPATSAATSSRSNSSKFIKARAGPFRAAQRPAAHSTSSRSSRTSRATFTKSKRRSAPTRRSAPRLTQIRCSARLSLRAPTFSTISTTLRAATSPRTNDGAVCCRRR